MELIKKVNIHTALILIIATLLISNLIVTYAPLTFSRTYKGATDIRTLDGVKATVMWTARYKAPPVMPEELKLDTEQKIDLYVAMRILTTLCNYTADNLSTKTLEEIQVKFDSRDMVKALMKGNVEIMKKLNMIKSVKIHGVVFEQQYLDNLKQKTQMANNIKNQ